MTTPADELRAAAAKLAVLTGELGDNRGPWYIENQDQRPYPQEISNRGVPYCVATTTTDPSVPPYTALYICAMHPGVGKALADWLDQEAHHYECGIRAADDVFHDDPAGHEAFLTTGPGAPSAQALAVARAILGSQP